MKTLPAMQLKRELMLPEVEGDPFDSYAEISVTQEAVGSPAILALKPLSHDGIISGEIVLRAGYTGGERGGECEKGHDDIATNVFCV